MPTKMTMKIGKQTMTKKKIGKPDSVPKVTEKELVGLLAKVRKIHQLDSDEKALDYCIRLSYTVSRFDQVGCKIIVHNGEEQYQWYPKTGHHRKL